MLEQLAYVATYLVVINFWAFFMVYTDKEKAKAGERRISEAALFFSAIVGGTPLFYVAMQKFRHKTKHKRFTIGIPLIFCIQLGLVVYYCLQGVL